MSRCSRRFPRLLARGAVLAAVLAVALAGVACLKTEDKVTMEKDGSGSFSRTTAVDLGVMRQLVETGRMLAGESGPSGDGTGGGDEFEDFDLPIGGLEELKERVKAVEGVRLEKSAKERKDGKLTESVEGKFADLESLAKVGLFTTASVELSKNEDGSFTLRLDPMHQFPSIPGPDQPGGAGGVPGMPQGADPGQMLAIFEPMLGGFEVKHTIAVPGTVSATNGVKSEDGKGVTWTLTFKDVIGAVGGKAVAQTVTFAGEGLALKPFAYAPEKLDIAALLERMKGGRKPAPAKDGAGGGDAPKGPDQPKPPETPGK